MHNDKEWVKDLKVGDKAVVGSTFRKSITTVTKITPKGFINTDSGHQFNIDGYQRGGGTWNRTSLLQLTDDLQLEFKKEKLVSQCKVIKFEELDIDQLEEILSNTIKEGK